MNGPKKKSQGIRKDLQMNENESTTSPDLWNIQKFIAMRTLKRRKVSNQ